MTDQEIINLLDAPWPEIPEELRSPRIVAGDIGRLGTLADAIGVDAAEKFFRENSEPFDSARRAAQLKLVGMMP